MASAGDGASAMMQVVDYEETFDTGLDRFLKTHGLATRGFDYHVAAIMGPQSSGKSTLLNLLFGTGFRTMDAAGGRYQVTQGVWLGRDVDARIVVMDLEGTDSRERGEDAVSFERKSALFALALAEVLIVNVWTQDVGRFNAANLALLKTVMELDMQLFYGAAEKNRPPSDAGPRMHKTRLLFVFRDHYPEAVGGTSVDRLEAILRQDVDNIWNSIAKPDAAKGTDVSHYFDLDFFALPHKMLNPDGFVAAGAQLKARFDDGLLFLPEYSRGVAADGFAAYAASVWETVRANKELDIPSQKEMLAHVRCEEIAREAIDTVDKALAPLCASLLPADASRPVAVDNLYPTMRDACDSAIEEYHASACRYSTHVAEMKAADLHTKLAADCKALYDAQATAVLDGASAAFRKAVVKIQQRDKPWHQWGTSSHGALRQALEMFDSLCAPGELPASALPPAANPHPLSFAQTSFKASRVRLNEALSQELSRATADVLAKAESRCNKMFVDSFKPPLGTVLDSASDDVWQRASEVATVAWEKTASHAAEVYGSEGLDFDKQELEEAVEDVLKPDCVGSAIRSVKELIGTPANFLHRMTKRFDDKFRFDDRGVPRHFGPEEDIEALFIAARENAEELVDLLSTVKLSGKLPQLRESARAVDPEVANPVIFEEHERAELRDKLRRQAGAVFMEAKRAQEAAKVTNKIPMWLIGVLLLFGWNEIMYVLRSPVLLILTIIVVPALYVGYAMDAPTVLGPAVRMTVRPYLQQAIEFAEQFAKADGDSAPSTTARPVAPGPPSANATSAASSSGTAPE